MSRVDEFATSASSALIARIEWRDGEGATWGDFAVDPADATRKVCALTGTAGAEGVAEVTHADGTTRVYIVQVGQQVVWDSSRGTYSFPR